MKQETAPIIASDPGRMQFQVDDVQPTARRLPVRVLASLLEDVLAGPVLASSHPADAQLVVGKIETLGDVAQVNPLVAAVHLAFSEHRPLELDPDAIWLTIAQGFAQHVNLHHEDLRDRLVRHEGRRSLEIARARLHSREDWNEAIESWADLLAVEVGPGLANVLTCDFSTTTSITRTASQIVLMDAFQRYFDFRERTICGIPTVTLRGTPDDWRRIRERIEILAEYNLEWWVARLRPICDALLETALGRPPHRFWQQIYKPTDAYGGDVVTGWVADLFPYIKHYVSDAPVLQNPLFSRPRSEIEVRHGLAVERFPTGLSSVPCYLREFGKATTARLVVGFVGVVQRSDGTLAPEIGWAVGGLDAFGEQLQHLAEHGTFAEPPNWTQTRYIPELPKEVLQLLDSFQGQTLYADSGHSWRVRSLNELDRLKVVGSYRSVSVFLDLEDGRVIGCCWETIVSGSIAEGTYRRQEEALWVVLGRPQRESRGDGLDDRFVLDAANSVTIAKGIPELMERILGAGGTYYFDAPDFTPPVTFPPAS